MTIAYRAQHVMFQLRESVANNTFRINTVNRDANTEKEDNTKQEVVISARLASGLKVDERPSYISYNEYGYGNSRTVMNLPRMVGKKSDEIVYRLSDTVMNAANLDEIVGASYYLTEALYLDDKLVSQHNLFEDAILTEQLSDDVIGVVRLSDEVHRADMLTLDGRTRNDGYRNEGILSAELRCYPPLTDEDVRTERYVKQITCSLITNKNVTHSQSYNSRARVMNSLRQEYATNALRGHLESYIRLNIHNLEPNTTEVSVHGVLDIRGANESLRSRGREEVGTHGRLSGHNNRFVRVKHPMTMTRSMYNESLQRWISDAVLEQTNYTLVDSVDNRASVVNVIGLLSKMVVTDADGVKHEHLTPKGLQDNRTVTPDPNSMTNGVVKDIAVEIELATGACLNDKRNHDGCVGELKWCRRTKVGDITLHLPRFIGYYYNTYRNNVLILVDEKHTDDDSLEALAKELQRIVGISTTQSKARITNLIHGDKEAFSVELEDYLNNFQPTYAIPTETVEIRIERFNTDVIWQHYAPPATTEK